MYGKVNVLYVYENIKKKNYVNNMFSMNTLIEPAAAESVTSWSNQQPHQQLVDRTSSCSSSKFTELAASAAAAASWSNLQLHQQLVDRTSCSQLIEPAAAAATSATSCLFQNPTMWWKILVTLNRARNFINKIRGDY